MNNKRRNDIESIIRNLSDIRSRIENVSYDEQEAYDNLPESLQDGERGDAMMSAIDALKNASGAVDEAIDALEEAKQ